MDEVLSGPLARPAASRTLLGLDLSDVPEPWHPLWFFVSPCHFLSLLLDWAEGMPCVGRNLDQEKVRPGLQVWFNVTGHLRAGGAWSCPAVRLGPPLAPASPVPTDMAWPGCFYLYRFDARKVWRPPATV